MEISNLRELPAFIAKHEQAHLIQQNIGYYPVPASDNLDAEAVAEINTMCGKCVGSVIGRALGTRPERLKVELDDEASSYVNYIMTQAAGYGLVELSCIDFTRGVNDLFRDLHEASPRFRDWLRTGILGLKPDECDILVRDAMESSNYPDTWGCLAVGEHEAVDCLLVMEHFLHTQCGAPEECFRGCDWPVEISHAAVFQRMVDEWLPEEYGRDAHDLKIVRGLTDVKAPVKEPELA